jgi:hypothetical protein
MKIHCSRFHIVELLFPYVFTLSIVQWFTMVCLYYNFDCLYYNVFVAGILNNIQGGMIKFRPKRQLMLIKGGLKPANLLTMM